jgi:hypothetical protein
VSACNPVNPSVPFAFNFLLDPAPEEWGFDYQSPSLSEEWGLDPFLAKTLTVLVDRAEQTAKQLQVTAQIPSSDYFLKRGYPDPLGRAGNAEISWCAADSLNPFSGVVIEPPQKMYDDNLHNIALKPFLDAYDAETDWRKRSAIFKALFKPASIELGIVAVLESINREFPDLARPLPDLVTPQEKDWDETGKLRRKMRREAKQVSWEEDESNHGARFTYAAWAHTVDYRPKRATLETFLSDASEKVAHLFKNVLVDSAEIWYPRKKKKSKGIDPPKTLYVENGELVYACTRGCNLSFRNYVCFHGIPFTNRCTEACAECRIPHKETKFNLSTTFQPSIEKGSCFSTQRGNPQKTRCVRADAWTYKFWEKQLKIRRWDEELQRGRDQSMRHLRRKSNLTVTVPVASMDEPAYVPSTQFSRSGIDHELDAVNDLGSEYSSGVSLDAMLRDGEDDPNAREDSNSEHFSDPDSADSESEGFSFFGLDFGATTIKQARIIKRVVPEWMYNDTFVRGVIDGMYPHPHQDRKRHTLHWLVDAYFRRMEDSTTLCETLALSQKGLDSKLSRFKERAEKAAASPLIS